MLDAPRRILMNLSDAFPKEGPPRWLASTVLVMVLWSPALTLSQTSATQLVQVAPPVLPLPRTPPRLPEKAPPARPAPLVPHPPPSQEKRVPKPSPRVFVREIQVIGGTVFSPGELAGVTAPYTNRELSLEDIEELRKTLTRYYVDRGYITSGAVVPDQTVTEGILRVHLVEGRLGRIEVEGNEWFRSSYFQSRIAQAAGPPLNAGELQERLRLLQSDPRIQQLQAELKRGPTREESVLSMRVTDANPFKAWLEFNNYQSPIVGAEQGFVTVADQNVLGIGDALSLQYGRSSGVNPILNFRYAIPVNAYDTTISAHYRRFDFAVIEEPFKAFEIKNEAEIVGVGLRHPVYRTREEEFSLGLTAEHETNKSTLLGAPFELIPGARNGVFRVSALRFSQEWTRRTGAQVISAFSRFSLGIGSLGATANADPALADSRFFSWLGSAQWARQLQPRRVQLLARGLLQLSNDHLFPLEQIAVGGRHSVRGYREYTFIRDNAFLASFEARIPVIESASGGDLVHLVPFVDVGHSWDTTVHTPQPQTLSSVGLGLLWNIRPGSHFEVHWGQRLKNVASPGGNLQDHGVHLQLIMEVF